MFGLGDAHFVSIFHPAELLELLDAFEIAGRKSVVVEKGFLAIGVKSQMFQVARVDGIFRVANPGNWRAGKIERITVEIENNFYDIWIHDVFGVLQGNG